MAPPARVEPAATHAACLRRAASSLRSSTCLTGLIIHHILGMRPHMRFFVNGEQVLDLAQALGPGDEVQIVQALSGGA